VTPYTDFPIELPLQCAFIRVFDNNTESDEFVWHRDHEDRRVTVINGSGWGFQFDNEMPFHLNEGDTINIKKMTFHRLLKGDTPLVLKILKTCY
jgi:hypothetical protein